MERLLLKSSNHCMGILLAEYHLMLLNDRLTSLKETSGLTSDMEDIDRKIQHLKNKGLNLKEKGLIKTYINTEVTGTPKLIKYNNNTVGIALQIGEKKINNLASMPSYFVYMRLHNQDYFLITETPTEFVTEIGSYPKRIEEFRLQLAISPILTHLDTSLEYKLVFEKYETEVDKYIGTIRTTPQNYYVASVLIDNSLLFGDIESKTRDIDKVVVEDMWKRGLIENKERNFV